MSTQATDINELGETHGNWEQRSTFSGGASLPSLTSIWV